MSGDLVIRAITADDVDTLLDLMGRLADNQNERAHLTVTADQLRESGFGAAPKWRGLLAESDGAPLGYATYTEDFHLWSGAGRMTLDDLYVAPQARSQGIGKKLLEVVFEMAEKTGSAVHWQVQTGNHRAIAFYERLGAHYRVVGKCIYRPGRK